MKRSRGSEEDTSLSRGADGDNSFSDSDLAPVPPTKIVDLEINHEHTRSEQAMKCSMPGHKEGLTFGSYEEYATHYNSAHTNRCLECHKNLPSSLLLDIHIEECHDVFIAAKRDKGEKTYTCFVEGCERKCSTPEKRRLHLIDKHMYPRNYFFAVTKAGVDGRRSMLVENGQHRRQSSSQSLSRPAGRRSSKIDIRPETAKKGTTGQKLPAKDIAQNEAPEEEKADVAMDDLAGAMSALQFVPNSVRFGRKEKVAFSRH